MKQLVFDTTTTDLDRDNVGAYIRASDGTLIDKITTAAVDRLAVDATIRDGAGNALTSTAGALDVNLASGSITVNEEDIFDEDSPHTPSDKGSFVLSVRQDTLAASTSADGDYAAFKVDSVGSLYVKATDSDAILTTIDADTGSIAASATSIDATLTGLSQAEDAVHGSGDAGIMALAVRNDAGTALAADGDYIPFSMTSAGNLRVDIASVTIDTSTANVALAHGATSVDSALGGTDLVASALANRKYLHLANEGNKKAYIGTFSSVTISNGFPISPGEKMILRAGASIDPAAITSAGTADMRYLELS